MSWAEGLLMGLAGGVAGAAGAAGDAERKKQELEQAKQKEMELETFRSELLLQRTKALEDYKREVAKQGAADVETTAQGLLAENDAQAIMGKHGGTVTADDVRPLNAEQRKAYGLSEPSYMDQLRAREQAAASLGETDLAKEYRGQFTAERSYQQSERQHEESMASHAASRAVQQAAINLSNSKDRREQAQGAALADMQSATSPEIYNAARDTYIRNGGALSILTGSFEEKEVDDPLTGEPKKTRTAKIGLDGMKQTEFQAYTDAKAALAAGMSLNDVNKRLVAGGYKPLSAAK